MIVNSVSKYALSFSILNIKQQMKSNKVRTNIRKPIKPPYNPICQECGQKIMNSTRKKIHMRTRHPQSEHNKYIKKQVPDLTEDIIKKYQDQIPDIRLKTNVMADVVKGNIDLVSDQNTKLILKQLLGTIKQHSQILSNVNQVLINYPNHFQNDQISINSKKIAESIISKINHIILDILTRNIANIIYITLKTKKVFSQELKNKLIDKTLQSIQNLKIKFSSDNWSDVCQNYYQNVILQKYKSKPPDVTLISHHRTSYKFLKQFQETDVIIQNPIIDKLWEMSSWKRNIIAKFYNKMVLDLNLDYRLLPKILINNEKKKISFDPIQYTDVFKKIKQLFSKMNYQLGLDLYAMLFLGFRKPEFTKVYFQQNNKFANIIHIQEQKNYKRTGKMQTRIIPNSFLFLIQKFNIKYPINNQRFRTLQQFSISQFGRFYGLRKLFITKTMTAVYKSQPLVQYHQNISTTLKFYINFENWQLMNKIFGLNIQGEPKNHPTVLTKFLFLFDKSQALIQQIQTGIDCIQIPQDKEFVDILKEVDQQDIDLINENSQQQTQIDLLNLQQKIKLNGLDATNVLQFKKKFYKFMNKRLLNKNYTIAEIQGDGNCLINCLSKIKNSQPMQLRKKLCQMMYEEKILNQQQYLKFRKNYTQLDDRFIQKFCVLENCQVIIQFCSLNKFNCFNINNDSQNKYYFAYYCNQLLSPHYNYLQKQAEIQQDQNDQIMDIQNKQLTKENNDNRGSNSDDDQKFSQSNCQMQIQNQKINMINVQSPIPQKCFFSINRPKCKICKRQLRVNQCQNGCAYVACICTIIKHHKCIFQRPILQYVQIEIIPNQKKMSKPLNFIRLKYNSVENNIISTIKKLNYIYTDKYLFQKNIISKVKTNLCILTDQDNREVLWNRQNQGNICLKVDRSLIKEAGNGVFCTQNVIKNSIICTYIGQVVQCEYCNGCKSNYEIGWFGKHNLWVRPQRYTNIGRFINSAVTKIQMNCVPVKAVCNIKGKYEIAIIIYAIKDIPRGSQLYYPYGKGYWIGSSC